MKRHHKLLVFSVLSLLALAGLGLLLARDLFKTVNSEPTEIPVRANFPEERLSKMDRDLLDFFRSLPDKKESFLTGANPFFTTYFDPPPLPDPPIASFDLSHVEGEVPLTVTLRDQSTGAINEWVWDFGNGESASDSSPSHTFEAEGEFTVRLTVIGDGGESTSEALVRVSAPPPPDPEPPAPRQVTLVYRGFLMNSLGEIQGRLSLDERLIEVAPGTVIEEVWSISEFNRSRMLLIDAEGEIIELSFNQQKTMAIPELSEEDKDEARNALR